LFREKKRRPKLPLRAYLMYITLLSFLLTGVTFSKYVTRSSASDSARVVKFGNVEISETVPSGGWVIVPGVNITKDATVNVSASEVDTFIFVKVAASGFTTADNRSFTTHNDQITWSVNSSWDFLKAENGYYIYYTYLDTNTELSRNIITNNTVTVAASITEADMKQYYSAVSIDFTASMVQGGGFVDADSAWYAINH